MGEPEHRARCREPSTVSRYLNLLGASTARAGSILCVGIDPVPSSLPLSFRDSHAGMERWVDTLIAATAPHAAAFKMNLAYFEALGSEGVRLAERVRRQVPAEIPLIIDAKRVGRSYHELLNALEFWLDERPVPVPAPAPATPTKQPIRAKTPDAPVRRSHHMFFDLGDD